MAKALRAAPMTDLEYTLCKSHWAEVYILNNNPQDPHTEFANLVGCSRQRAKELCWMFTFKQRSSHFFKIYHEETKIRGALVMRVKGLLEDRGIKQSIYQIYDAADLEVEAKERMRIRMQRGIRG